MVHTADKHLWPDAVFPSDIPGAVPLALNVKLADVLTSSKAGTHNAFEFPQEVNLFSVGTLGNTFSFFGELTFGERPDSGVETLFSYNPIGFHGGTGLSDAGGISLRRTSKRIIFHFLWG